MSLRDWFASSPGAADYATMGMVTYYPDLRPGSPQHAEKMANMQWEYADAMLAAREYSK